MRLLFIRGFDRCGNGVALQQKSEGRHQCVLLIRAFKHNFTSMQSNKQMQRTGSKPHRHTLRITQQYQRRLKDTIKYTRSSRRSIINALKGPHRSIVVTLYWSRSTQHTYTQASHSHLSHTITVFIQALDGDGANQRGPFTSHLG